MSSLKKRAIRGASWTILGYGMNNILRLGSNLILTRLLFPEAFGLMALVQSFLVGLEMFSDIGIIPSIIQNKRGDDPAFLNTAWTIQVIRGNVLWLCTCILAFPAAEFFREPMLAQLLPVVGLTSSIAGFNSTKLATVNRHLRLGRLTIIELGSYILALLVMITWAWLYRSVWALVAGGLVSALAKMLLSHFFLEGERNRFQWEAEAFAAITQFGRWIFFSTLLGFFASQGDRLVIARLLDVEFLGIYSIALNLSLMAEGIISQIGNKVLFASYSELARERPERLYDISRRNRFILAAIGTAVALIFVFFGERIIDLLYDSRYTEAGWILKVLAIGTIASFLHSSYTDLLLAKDRAFALAGLLLVKVIIQFVAMFTGYYLGGVHGVVIGIAAIEWLVTPFQMIWYSRLSILQPEVDLPFLGVGVLAAIYVYFS